MRFKKFRILIYIVLLISTTSCKTVSQKIDKATEQEEKELSRWLNQTEDSLKSFYGQPDEVKFLSSRNRVYIIKSKKFKIVCERKFEINPRNIVVGFKSKNCF